MTPAPTDLMPFDPATHKFGMAYKCKNLTLNVFGKCAGGYNAICNGGPSYLWDDEEATRAPEHDLVPRQAVTGDESELVKLAYLRGVLETTNNPLSDQADIENCIIGFPPEHADDEWILKWFKKHKVAIRNLVTQPAVPAEPTDPLLTDMSPDFKAGFMAGIKAEEVLDDPDEPTDKDAIEALEWLNKPARTLCNQFDAGYGIWETEDFPDHVMETIRRALSATAREGKLVSALRQLLTNSSVSVHQAEIIKDALAAHDKERK
jgi:hypothetical protein